MFCVSVPLNSVCLFALRYAKEIEKPTKIFLMSLTASELGACILYVLPAIVSSITDEPPFTGGVCVVQYVLFNTCANSIYTSLLAVNVDRHIAVTQPLRYRCLVTATRARITVVVIWLVSLLHTILFTIAGRWEAEYDMAIQVCLPIPKKEFLYDFMTIYIIVFMNLVLMSAVILFIKLRRLVKNQAARIAELEISSDSSSGEHGGNTPTKRNIRAATTIFFMTVAVICAVIPWEVAILLTYSGHQLLPWVSFLIEACFVAGGWLDALVYYFRNRAIREAAIYVLKCRCIF